jgi:hypothetical protein
MKSITQDYRIDKTVSLSIKSFFKKYKVSAALRAANAYKSKGISVSLIFQYLFSLVFTDRSMQYETAIRVSLNMDSPLSIAVTA